MIRAESSIQLLEDMVATFQGNTLGPDESVIVNFEFDSREYLPQPLRLLSRTLQRFMPHPLVFSRDPDTSHVLAYNDTIIDTLASMVAAVTPGGIEAYRVLVVETDRSAPFTIQYSTDSLNHARALFARFNRIEPVHGALTDISYAFVPKLTDFKLAALADHFDQLFPECLCVPNHEAIIGECADKGWRLYLLHETKDAYSIHAEEGPVLDLRVGSTYSVIPLPDDLFEKERIEAVIEHARITNQPFRNEHSPSHSRPIALLHCRRDGVCLVDDRGSHHTLDRKFDLAYCIRNHYTSYDATKRPDVLILN